MNHVPHRDWMMIVFLLCFAGGCSNDKAAKNKSDNAESDAVDIASLIGRPRAEIPKEFGLPDEPDNDRDSFTKTGLILDYDKNQVVRTAYLREIETPPSVKVELFRAQIGDSINKLISLWGEPYTKAVYPNGYAEIRWMYRDLRIDVHTASSSVQQKESDIPVAPNTVLTFCVQRPEPITNLPFPDGAKEVLKRTLDCWILGDSLSQFKEEHDDVDVWESGVFDWSEGNTLLRYEIGAFRGIKNLEDIYTNFAVTLVFQSKAGTEIKNAINVKLTSNKGIGKYEVEFCPK